MRDFSRHLCMLALLLFACAHPALAQNAPPLDPALLESEPVEETPEEIVPEPAPKKKTGAAKPDIAVKEIAPVIEEKLPEPNVALLQGLNKVTAKIVTIEVPVNITVPFGTLGITLKKCWRAAPEEKPENAALLEIIDTKPGEEPKGVFSGWMFSSSPAVSALEHPVYDVTMIECVAK